MAFAILETKGVIAVLTVNNPKALNALSPAVLQDIDAAIGVIKKEFSRNWKGCTLTEIYYAGDDVSQEHAEWAERNGADEVIVLTSSFDVDESGASPTLNPGQTYTRWMWILVRSNGGKWQHVDHGY